jgi:hypothetical protein
VAGQIGLEETPEAYVAKLVAVFAEVKRVLDREGHGAVSRNSANFSTRGTGQCADPGKPEGGG